VTAGVPVAPTKCVPAAAGRVEEGEFPIVRVGMVDVGLVVVVAAWVDHGLVKRGQTIGKKKNKKPKAERGRH